MKSKIRKFLKWKRKKAIKKKVRKILFRACMTALCLCAAYLVFVHRDQIGALIRGVPLRGSKGKRCPFFCGKRR